MAEKLTLASMCAGGVQERIDRALAKISDNILDLNTDAKKKRTLDIKIVLTPSEDDREDVAVEVQTSVKLAPEMGLKTQLFINKDFRSGVEPPASIADLNTTKSISLTVSVISCISMPKRVSGLSEP